MLTQKDYCDYDTCVALKELGVKGYAHPFVNVPKIPLWIAQKFLREEKKIHVEVHIAFNMYFYELFKTNEYDKHCGIQKVLVLGTNGYESHEEALWEGIKEAINKVVKGGKEMIDKDFINEIIERASEEGVCYNHKYECVYKLVQNYILQHDMEKEEK